MSSNDIITEPSANTDKSVPVDSDKVPITSDGNDAKILGHLEEFRNGSAPIVSGVQRGGVHEVE